jgi:hypothetical protein
MLNRKLTRGRALAWLGGVASLTAVTLGLAVPGAASASSMPQTDWSYYVTSLNTSTAATLGCNQGKFDASHGNINSTATLDFGGQNSSNNGTILTFSGTQVSYSQVESYAETFGYNYWLCTGADTTSYLTMSIGTNNSAYYVNSSGGASWAGVVNAVASYMNSYGQVTVWGANDMELDWASYSATSGWESGYAGHTSALYNDYGDAAGCPPYGSCDNGWTQHDVYLVAWGDPPAEVTPEIYYTSQGNEWVSVSNTQGLISFWGPLDEYDLDSGTLTASQAWSALQCNGAQTCLFSLQIHKAS